MGDIIKWFTDNWVSIVAGLWALEQLLRVIAGITKNKWDDNLVSILNKILSKFFPKR